jgi:mono/diheme cytochrome c family protein
MRRTLLRHEKIDPVIGHLKRILSFLIVALSVLAASPASASGSKAKADELAGATLFRKLDCAHCHGEGGIGTKKAPSLVDIRRNKEWTPARITSQILNGGQKMPPFSDSLTDDEIAQLVAYLRAKHRPVPPPVSQGTPGR